MSRKIGQIIARGERRWLVRVYLARARLRKAQAQLPQSNNLQLATARTGVPDQEIA